MLDYDVFGRIYEYFLGEFVRTEGQKGGESYTPSCIVCLLTEVIEPDHGPILDPACGSTEFIVLRPRTLTPEFVHCLARSDEFRGVAIKSMPGATGRQRVQEQCFDDFQIAQPPRDLHDQFSAIVAQSFRLIYKLHLQIQNLRRTRDLPLPLLLSGHMELPLNPR